MKRSPRKNSAAVVWLFVILTSWQSLPAASEETTPVTVPGKAAPPKSNATQLAALDELASSRINLLANPSFEQEANVTDESSLPGWELDFRRKPDQPPLTPDEAVVMDDAQQSHCGGRFLRLQPGKRDIFLRSPRPESANLCVDVVELSTGSRQSDPESAKVPA